MDDDVRYLTGVGYAGQGADERGDERRDAVG